MKIVVTGAAGFLGRALTNRLLSSAQASNAQFYLNDRMTIMGVTDPRVRCITGDLGEPELIDELLADARVVYHLAAMPGGAAEADYEGSCRTNLATSLQLLDRAAREPSRVRFVYASSIAVFGTPLPAHIDDATCPGPSMTYGAHKLMVSISLANLVRMQRLDGFALHLPGLVARPRSAAGLTSSFMSDIFHALANRERYVMPMSATATAWLMSLKCCVDNLVHAATMPSPRTGAQRAFALPVVRVSMRQLVDEIVRQTQADQSCIEFKPDVNIEARFGSLPPLTSSWSESLGFRSDGNLQSLVTHALADAGLTTS